MRKVLAGAVAGLIAGIAPGCARKKIRPPVEDDVSQPASLSSTIKMSDPAAAFQLLRGFYPVEQGPWRWTMQRFAVALQPPQGAAQNGAELVFRFSVPKLVLDRLGKITLMASTSGQNLAPETYAKTGEAVYSRPVPPSAFVNEPLTIDFAMDRALAAGAVESRELGVVAIQVSLDPK